MTIIDGKKTLNRNLNPTGKGGFKKGQSGNPGGRPKALVEVKKLAQAHTEDAISALSEIVKNRDAPPAARVAASQVLLDRGWGKPTQTIDANVNFMDKMSVDEQRSLLAALTAIAVDSDGDGEGADTTHH
jgi:hypothetical protein